ncbi:hypothetical protein ALC60_05797, partial [Trachymyrmex zeteki]
KGAERRKKWERAGGTVMREGERKIEVAARRRAERERQQLGAAVHRFAAAADVSPWTKKDRAEKGTHETAASRHRRARRKVGQVSRCNASGSGKSAREGGHACSENDGAAATAEADVPAVAEIIVRSSSLRSALRLLSSPLNDVPHQIWLYPSRRVSVLGACSFRDT